MADLMNAFGGEAVAEAADTKKTEKKEFLKGLKSDLQTKITTDPEYVSKLHTCSDNLEVVKTLGFGTTGNVVVDKTAEERKLKQTSTIVGYEVRNVGEEPIKYATEIWEQGEDGKYVARPVEATIGKGESVYLTKKFMTILCSRPEISFILKNGKIVSKVNKGKDVETLLNSFYFQFSDDTPVNDDTVKKAIDEDGVVKPEFVAAFGYLNNPKEKSGRGRGTGASKQKLTVQDMMANYVHDILKEQA